MNWLKKFWIAFISFLPFSAGAFWPLAIGGIVFGGSVIGYSVYRSVSPVNMADALSFFSTCWSCQLFSDVISNMSSILPQTYSALGKIIITFSIALLALWFAWYMLQLYVMPGKSKEITDGWNIGGQLGLRITKVLIVAGLLLVPLPRMVSEMVIEPVFNIGLSMNYTMTETDLRKNYANCVIVSAIKDKQSIYNDNQKNSINAFSPRFRHNLTCQIANIHQMTGLGMTVGWTLLNMAFNHDYLHRTLIIGVPIFPNIPLLIVGFLILALYFAALLPIPLYFLEIFVKLSIDFILLPLTLLSWIFPDWKLFPSGNSNLKQIIDDVISGALGIAMTGIFITFSIMVIQAVFGTWDGANVLQHAIITNNSQYLVDGLMLTQQNNSLVAIILMGIFMLMFMLMIPALIKSLFNVNVSDKYYETAKKDIKILWNGAKKFWKSAKK